MPDSIVTKNAIANSFKSLMNVKSFEKITISEITDNCGLNRLTFYYHFHDKFELLDWIMNEELFVPFSENLSFANILEKFEMLFEVMKQNEIFYRNALKNSESEFQNYLAEISFVEFKIAIEDFIKINGNEVEEEVINFVAKFFAHGITGVVLDWTNKSMKTPPKDMVNNLNQLIISSRKILMNGYFS